MTYASTSSDDRKEQSDVAAVRNRLIEAESVYQAARAGDYVARLIRDGAIVEAHRAGLSSRVIGELVGDMDQANVVRARRRAVTRREIVPDGLLNPVDAVRRSGLGPAEFVAAIRDGRLVPVDLHGGVRAFRPEEIDSLASRGQV